MFDNINGNRDAATNKNTSAINNGTRKEYFDLMGFQQGSDKHRNALKRAHEIRKFEIELYWERNKYMYLIVSVIFLGVFNEKIYGEDETIRKFVQLCLLFVGMIVAFAWVLINKGSKFWLENWESHIDMLEDEFEGNLYKVVDRINFKKNAWSVSKVNIYLSIFIFICFSVLFIIFFLKEFSLNYRISFLENIRQNFDRYSLLFVLALFVWVLFLINVVFAGFKWTRVWRCYEIFTLKFLRPKLPVKTEQKENPGHEFTIRDRTHILTPKANSHICKK